MSVTQRKIAANVMVQENVTHVKAKEKMTVMTATGRATVMIVMEKERNNVKNAMVMANAVRVMAGEDLLARNAMARDNVRNVEAANASNATLAMEGDATATESPVVVVMAEDGLTAMLVVAYFRDHRESVQNVKVQERLRVRNATVQVIVTNAMDPAISPVLYVMGRVAVQLAKGAVSLNVVIVMDPEIV